MLDIIKTFFNAILNYDPEASGAAKANVISDFLAKVFAYIENLMGIA